MLFSGGFKGVKDIYVMPKPSLWDRPLNLDLADVATLRSAFSSLLIYQIPNLKSQIRELLMDYSFSSSFAPSK
jgi:hypothetical protein